MAAGDSVDTARQVTPQASPTSAWLSQGGDVTTGTVAASDPGISTHALMDAAGSSTETAVPVEAVLAYWRGMHVCV